jgi:hypothetical protein
MNGTLQAYFGVPRSFLVDVLTLVSGVSAKVHEDAGNREMSLEMIRSFHYHRL